MTSPAEERSQRFQEAEKTLDNRSAFQRDRDRLLYSSAFRRLAGITQVVAADEGHVFHNRLTHTLKVAQVGRRAAERLLDDQDQDRRRLLEGQLDPDVVESAGIAHDLGHPPFGHVGEEVLQELMLDVDPGDSFEGNAQSFRIVTHLSICNPKWSGLNLTRATLNATLKYPWLHDAEDKNSKAYRKWGSYQTDADYLRFARGLDPAMPAAELPEPSSSTPSLEASVMDWADDITYAVHDAEDFYRAGLVPLHLLRTQAKERERFAEYAHGKLRHRITDVTPTEVEKATELIEILFGSAEPYSGSKDQRWAVRSFASAAIGRFISATSLTLDGESFHLTIPRGQQVEVETLKLLTWYYVIERPALAGQQHGHKTMLRYLFETFMDAADASKKSVNQRLLPEGAITSLKAAEEASMDNVVTHARTICDTLCTMTEEEVRRMYLRLTGHNPGSITDILT